MNGPYFIVVEGLDGSGKTTQINHLRDYFQARGEACYLTAEPTDLATGRFIRRVLRGENTVDPRTLAALFAADRVEHLFHASEGIIAKLAAGYHVISSRYYFSSLAYQGEYVDPAWVASLNRLAKATLPADLTIFLDLNPEVSMQRIAGRGGGSELFETLEKLRQVREDFQQAFAVYGEGERIAVINAEDPEVDVAERIVEEVQQLR